MKKLIAVFLLVAMTMVLCACGTKDDAVVPATTPGGAGAAVNNGSVLGGGLMILTEKDVLPEGAYIAFEGVAALCEDGDSDRVQILKENGVAVNDKYYESVDSIIAEGICAVRNTDAEGNPQIGIVDANRGKELVPCEAIEINWLSDRFLMVNYMTGKGTGNDLYGSYYDYTDGHSKEYKGYGKILDLQEGVFVPGIEITTGEYGAEAFSNMIVVDTENYEQQVYKADGTLVGIYDRFYAYPDSGIAMHYTDDAVTVYGADMEVLTTLSTENDIDYDPVEGTSDMLMRENVKDGETYYCVTDLQGNPLTGEYDRIQGVITEGFLIVGEEDALRTVDFAGNVLVNGGCTYVAPGYLIQNVGYDSYFVYDTTGKKITETEFDYKDDLLLKTKDNRVLIYGTGELIQSKNYPFHLVGSLALIGSDVYDLITGDIVMCNVYDAVGTGSNLYVYNVETDQYTRYSAEYK